ncbi:DUF1521 domain-containing protein [Sphingomonas sp. CGMCC 1.13654]|uniref:DUF1521 domain-containing protein n=1 Tax=Sphingomonas chungangi TaxID=2683589 RepID=A0A838LFV1_9SPHN|nr:DUF1521 domain-containing protein [Sphingomonas chungangi]MBA2936308.1 DUF1521 domain-containing protein [Sphingomonas chungangi]MVW55693.1 DUF1521 domain-containing protein [Sphingomonas chungangi]
MTTITTASASATRNLQATTTAQEFVFAAGIVGHMFNPLGARPWASAQLPSMWTAALFSNNQPQAQWTASTGAEGQASIDLGDGYSLQLDENSSSATITDANTGQTTQIWGDPHVNVNGQHQFDFYGTTTFTLPNGTKITVNTQQSQSNPDVYYADTLTITKGSQGLTVTGLSEQTKGDLAITMGQNGYALDSATADGYVLDEKTEGSGWTSAYTGQDATQADLDETKPGSAFETLQQLSGLFGQFLAGAVLFGFAAEMGSDISHGMHAHAEGRAQIFA